MSCYPFRIYLLKPQYLPELFLSLLRFHSRCMFVLSHMNFEIVLPFFDLLT